MIQSVFSFLKGFVLLVVFILLFTFLIRPLINLTVSFGFNDYIGIEIMSYFVLIMDIVVCYVMFYSILRFFKRLQESE